MAEILIVGGGPTGLILAITLALHGAKFRIIDAAAGISHESRAMGVHARTLELYRPFGLDVKAVQEGIHSGDASIRVLANDGKPFEVAKIPFSTVGRGISRYPYILQYPQDQHERLLVEKLSSLGIEVERRTTIKSLKQTAAGVEVVLATSEGEEKKIYKYVCGADGAHSVVRHSIDVGFQGGTYEQPFYVADVKLAGDYAEAFMITLSANTMCVRMPVRKAGTTRLIGLVPKEMERKSDLTFEDVRAPVQNLIGSEVASVNWFSKYHVHHRVAEKYRVGNVFLLGDAAHVHSPMGGQGMNTGLGDSMNLAWKLAAVTQGNANEELLDTYETERRAFGEMLVNTTDKVFGIVMQDNFLGVLIRRFFWPLMVSIITRFDFARKRGFKFISQIHINYRHSAISTGKVGNVVAGDRLPWVLFSNGEDNFGVLDGLNWQIHIYGDAEVVLGDLDWIPVHHFPFEKSVEDTGLRENAVYFIRPDSHIGFASQSFDQAALKRYVHQLGLREQ